MLNELRTGKYAKDIATAEEVAAFVNEARHMVAEYRWEDRTVTPWGYAEKVTKTINYIADYRRCTFSSKQMLISLANGLARVMNAWEQQELTGITLRSIKTGKVVKVDECIVDLYLDNGFERV